MSGFFALFFALLAVSANGFCAPPRAIVSPVVRVTRPALGLRAMAGEGWDGENEDDLSDEMEVQKKKGRGESSLCALVGVSS
eukprot:scaffold434_cov186-Pinguiococcus_pyrenoidosus.AAC.89